MSCPDFASLDACQCPKNINTKTVVPEDSFVCLAETPTISEMRARLPYKDYTRVNLSKASEVRAAYLNSVKWKPGQTITVGFMRDKYFNADCVKTVQDVINSSIAPHVNLKFVWDAPISESMIRISFGPPRQASSWIGTGALRVDKSLPTMKLGFGCESGRHGTIIHEFGHALGMIHEHLRGDTTIKYDCPKLVNYLTGSPNFWACRTIKDNILDLTSVGEYDDSYSEYDPYSIMHYHLGNFRCDGGNSQENSQLSPCDIFMLQKTYPFEGASPTGACVVGPPLSRDENSIIAIIEKNKTYALIALAVTVGIIGIYNIAVHNKNKDNK
jgi:serralysin